MWQTVIEKLIQVNDNIYLCFDELKFSINLELKFNYSFTYRLMLMNVIPNLMFEFNYLMNNNSLVYDSNTKSTEHVLRKTVFEKNVYYIY